MQMNKDMPRLIVLNNTISILTIDTSKESQLTSEDDFSTHISSVSVSSSLNRNIYHDNDNASCWMSIDNSIWLNFSSFYHSMYD